MMGVVFSLPHTHQIKLMAMVVLSLTPAHQLQTQLTLPPKRFHTSNLVSTHSHSNKTDSEIVSNPCTKVLKRTFRKTAHIGDQVSVSAHSHS